MKSVPFLPSPHKTLIEQRSSGGLEQQTVPQFMLKQYDHLKQSEEVLKEIGICSTSPSQLACLVELPLPFLFSCLQLFATWVRDGIYDFNTLPLVVKTQITHQDLQLIQQIPLKWTGRCVYIPCTYVIASCFQTVKFSYEH